MGNKTSLSPLALALGAAFATSLAGTSVANADQNPFAMNQLSSGYMVADTHMEGTCGGAKGKEGKCGEGKCGGAKTGEGMCGMNMMDKNKDGNVSHAEFSEHHERAFARMDTNGDGIISASEMETKTDQRHEMKTKEGKCGEGKCGGNKVKEEAEGTIKGKEGKCGEGKCGGNKVKEEAESMQHDAEDRMKDK